MCKDIHTKYYWKESLDNPAAASTHERGFINAVKAANAAELRHLEPFLPALVSAEKARRQMEYSGSNGTAYRPEDEG